MNRARITTTRLGLGLALALALPSCGDDGAGATEGTGGSDSNSESTAGSSGDVDVDQQDQGDIPGLDGEVAPRARHSRRLTVDQLAATIPIIAGDDENGDPIGWNIQIGPDLVNILDPAALGATLGKPDYITVSYEPAIPDILYVKFMDDMARNVCTRIAQADLMKPESDRVLAKFAPVDGSASEAEIDENLRYLHLRFFGERVPDDDPAAIEGLRLVYDTAASGGNNGQIPASLEGWRSVCVALIKSPAFHIY